MRVDIVSSCRSLEAELVNAAPEHGSDGLTHELANSYYFQTRRDPQ